MQENVQLVPSLFVDVAEDWRVYIVERDVRNSGVYYVGPFPYDEVGRPLHPKAPAICGTWDGKGPGARQVSERQRRLDRLTSLTLVEPIHEILLA